MTSKSNSLKREVSAIAVLVLLVVVICGWFGYEYFYSGQLDRVASNEVAARKEWISDLRASGPATLKNVPSIQSWMTFDYINHLFALPSSYLQSHLSIAEARYPRLALEEYAEDMHLTQATVLTEVKNTVTTYLVTATTTTQ